LHRLIVYLKTLLINKLQSRERGGGPPHRPNQMCKALAIHTIPVETRRSGA